MNVFSRQTIRQKIKRLWGRSGWGYLFLLLPILLALSFISSKPESPDSWTRAAVGRFILENQTVPQHAEISFKQTDPNLQWLTHSWLADVVIFLVSRNSLVAQVFLLFFLVLSLYLLWRILKILEIPRPLNFWGVFLATVFAGSYWKLHPLIFLTPLVLSSVYLYLKWRKTGSRAVLLLPLLFLLCANVSGGFIFVLGGIFFLIVVLEGALSLVNRFLTQPIVSAKGKLHFLFLGFFSGLLISLLNPAGLSIWRYGKTFLDLILSPQKGFSTLVGSLTVSSINFVKEYPPVLIQVVFAVYVVLFILLLGFLIVRTKGKIIFEIYSLLPLSVFIVLAFLWIRFIPIVGLVSIPVFLKLLDHLVLQFLPKRILLARAILTVSFLAFSLPLTAYLVKYPPSSFAIKEAQEQADFIRENELSGNLVSSIEQAGYIFYRLYPNRAFLGVEDDFFDENDAVYVYTHLFAIPDEFFKSVVSGGNVGLFLINKYQSSLVAKINQDPNWALVYLDYNGILFVRKDTVSQEFLEKNSIRGLDFARNLGFDPANGEEVAKELEEFTARYPTKLAIGQLASVYRIQQNFEKAEEVLSRIPQDQWDYIVMTEMGRIQAAQGDCENAEGWFLKALNDRKEQNVSRTVFELAVLYAGCFQDMEKAKHFYDRYNSFPLSNTERERARVIAKDFGIIE